VLPPRYDENLLLNALDLKRVGTRKSGHGGEMERVDFKIHENYLAAAKRLLEINPGRLDSRSDIARVGFVLAIRWLSKIAEGDEILSSIMHQIALMEEKVAWEMRQLRNLKLIDSVDAMVKEQLSLPNGRVHVARVLRRLKGHIDLMDRGFYQAHFEREFNNRFSGLRQLGLELVEAGIEGESGEGEEGAAAAVAAAAEQQANSAAFDESAAQWVADERLEGLLREMDELSRHGSPEGDDAGPEEDEHNE